MIGVFDSGIGGLSILAEIAAALPQVPLHYIADSAHAPYGEKSADFVLARSLALCHTLQQHGAELIVVACNTATAIAIAALRQTLTLPIVGIEPGIKPGVEQSRNKKVGVLATSNTIASDKFQHLMAQYSQAAQLIAQPCPGWAGLIEAGLHNTTAGHALIDTHLQPVLDAGVDTLVLGCTHYIFIRDAIAQRAGPAITLVNPAQAIARRVAHLYSEHHPQTATAPTSEPEAANHPDYPTPYGMIELSTTGELTVFEHQLSALLPTLLAPARLVNCQLRTVTAN